MLSPVLRGSARTAENQAILDAYRQSLPAQEYRALELCLGQLYGYQQTFCLAQDRFAIQAKARQLGSSHTMALWAVITGAFTGDSVSIISVGQAEAEMVIAKVAKHAEAMAFCGSTWATPTLVTKSQVTLASGATIRAWPSTSAARGSSTNCILDEASYYQHPEQVFEAASGAATHGFKIRILSTPNGAGTWFHDFWINAAQRGYRRFSTNIEEAIGDGLPLNIEDCKALAKGDPRLYGQMFMCEFLDGDLQYFPSHMLNACFDVYATGDAGQFYGGIDIGESKDRTVLVILRRDGDKRHLHHIEGHKYTDDTLIDHLVEKAFKTYGCRSVALDSTGIGSFPAKRLRRQWGTKFIPLSFTLKSKEDLASGLMDVISSKRLGLPRPASATDEHAMLVDDLRQIRRIVTEAGNVRYDAPRGSTGHADRAWGLMLAAYAASRANALNAAMRQRLSRTSAA